MQSKIVDFAPRRTRKQPSLVPAIFVLLLCALAPAQVPHQTSAQALQIDGYVISPVPTSNQSILPTIELSENYAGESAAEGRASFTAEQSAPESTGTPSLEPADPVQIIQGVFGPDAPMALAIAKAESGLRCDAHSPTNDGGLFQINLDWHIAKFGHESPYDCLANAKVAKTIYDAQGWSPWVTYVTGAYRRYL